MKSLIHLALAVVCILLGSILVYAIPAQAFPATIVSEFSCADVTEIPQSECEVLVTFYNSTNGVNWTYNYNWLETNTPSNWWGIYLNGGHVDTISLSGNQLTGTIPSELSNLTELRSLILFGNQISGNIPPELVNLALLNTLHVAFNQLSGNIPSFLGNLPSLNYLNLSNNQFSGSIPPELGNLWLLNEMYLNNNLISGEIPPELGNIHYLSMLNISNTNLSGSLSPNLMNLSLDTFRFNNTGLCEPPDPAYQAWLNAIPNLQRTGILCPGNFVSCASVTAIPEVECDALVTLYNNTNGPGWTNDVNWMYTDNPGSWFGVTARDMHVVEINLSANNVDGSLVSQLGTLPGLTKLNLSNNQIDGSIPAVLGSDSNLSYLNLSRNQLSGSIPVELGALSKLTELYLWDNQLNGSIPAQLGNLSLMKYLDLKENLLSGNIPPDLGNITHLEALDLRNNQLDGAIPLEITDLPDLWLLALADNQLTGILPPELSGLTSLKVLVLSNNQLSGSIPAGLGDISSLAQIFLDGNQLSGVIPVNLGSLPELWILNLGSNQLSGTIPTTLGGLPRLTYLDLSNNQLSGNLPITLTTNANLWTLYLNGNQLSGSIPTELGNLINLQVLWLNDNHLEGDIPDTLTNLTNLANPGMVWGGKDGLDLDYNRLSIPAGYPDPGVPLQVFLSQKDPNWQMYQSFTQVIGTGGGELTSLDGKTSFAIPIGALNGDTTFTYIPQLSPHHPYGRQSFAHNSFEMTAQDSSGNPITAFNLPVTVTLTYTNTDIISFTEDTLGLYYWSGVAGRWVDSVTTCPGGEYIRDLEANILTVPLCHLTEFGLFGPRPHVFIPVIFR